MKKLLLILFCFVAICKADAGIILRGTTTGGSCDCLTDYKTGDSSSPDIYTAGTWMGQSFNSPGAGTSMTVTINVTAKAGGNATTIVYIDDDSDLSADTLGSDQIEVTSTGEACFEVTLSESVDTSDPLYFLIRVNENFADRINIQYKNVGTYGDGAALSDSDNNYTLTEFLGGTRDLYFDVCVGSSCSCS